MRRWRVELWANDPTNQEDRTKCRLLYGKRRNDGKAEHHSTLGEVDGRMGWMFVLSKEAGVVGLKMGNLENLPKVGGRQDPFSGLRGARSGRGAACTNPWQP